MLDLVALVSSVVNAIMVLVDLGVRSNTLPHTSVCAYARARARFA